MEEERYNDLLKSSAAELPLFNALRGTSKASDSEKEEAKRKNEYLWIL